MENENVNDGLPTPEEQSVPAKPPTPEVKPRSRKEPPKSVRPKKELTPAEIQKRKKMLVMPLFFLIFGAAMWLIFAPSGKDKEKEAQQAGLNMELPTPKDGGLLSDKRDAYEKDAMQQREKDRMHSLQDYANELEQTKEQSQEQEEQEQQWKNSPSSSSRHSSSTGAIQSSTAAYKDINRQLGAWYEQPATEVDEQSQLELQWRIQELERKSDEEAARKKTQDEQLELLEKSYQLAAKYMPQSAPAQAAPDGQPVSQGASGVTTSAVTSASPAGQSGKTAVQPVNRYARM
jgi:conjugative transposon TraM protein